MEVFYRAAPGLRLIHRSLWVVLQALAIETVVTRNICIYSDCFTSDAVYRL